MYRRKIIERIKTSRGLGYVMRCIVCRKHFRIKRWDYDNQNKGVYCSNKCRGKYQKENFLGKKNPNWKGGLYEFDCIVCKKRKKIKKKELKSGGGKYCSRRCKDLDLSRVKREYFEKYPEARMKYSRLGKLNPMWLGGKSFEPYSLDWTGILKRAIRERDNYICQLCGQHGNICHHINYDKKNCNSDNLITLCNRCNSKVNSNRKYWIGYFQDMIKK